MSSNIVRTWSDTQDKVPALIGPRIIFGKERIIYLRGVISNVTLDVTPDGPVVSADDICDALLLLDKESSEPIKMVIHSPGGHIDDGFLIVDTIVGLRSPLWTFVRSSASFATVITVLGEKGHRYILPSSFMHLHGAKMGIAGEQADVEKAVEFAKKRRERWFNILIERTKLFEKNKKLKALVSSYKENSKNSSKTDKKPQKSFSQEDLKEIEREALLEWIGGEHYFTAEEAIAYGLVDKIVTPEIQRDFFNIR